MWKGSGRLGVDHYTTTLCFQILPRDNMITFSCLTVVERHLVSQVTRVSLSDEGSLWRLVVMSQVRLEDSGYVFWVTMTNSCY